MNTKRGKGTNSFSNADIDAIGFENYQRCWQCEKNFAVDLHHNLNRQWNNADSILNAIPLCKDCHIMHGSSSLPKYQKKFFLKALNNAIAKQYQFKDKDKKYIVEYFFDDFEKWKKKFKM